jgi:hypothetical protein
MIDRILGWLATYGVLAIGFFGAVLGVQSERLSLIVLGTFLWLQWSIRESTNKIIAAIREQR